MGCIDRNERMKSRRRGLALAYVCFEGEGIISRLTEHSLRILVILFQHGFFSSLAFFLRPLVLCLSLNLSVCACVCMCVGVSPLAIDENQSLQKACN